MSYKEFSPPSELSDTIECVWTRIPNAHDFARAGDTRTNAPTTTQTILPDGATDIIATFFPDGDVDETFVVGAMTQPQLATLGNEPIVGVRFLPGVGGSAFRLNATTLTNDQADISDVFKQTSKIRDAFRTLRMNASHAHALHLFAESIALEPRNVPQFVRLAAKQLAQSSVPLRVEQVAKNLGITRQHLARSFSAHSGVTPKLFAQICRVRSLLAYAQSSRVNNKSRDTWSSLAVQFGYTDQSHLIAEVQAIIGQTPAAWQANAGSNIPIVPVPVSSL